MLERLGKDSITFTVKGKKWKTGTLTPLIVAGFRDWVAARIGDPFADAKAFAGKVGDDVVAGMIREGKAVKAQLDCFNLESPLAKQYLSSQLGMTKLLQLFLLEHHPDATEENAMDILLEMSRKHEEDEARNEAQKAKQEATRTAGSAA